MKISQVFKDFKGRNGGQVESRGGGRRGGGVVKRGGLIDVSCHLQIPRRYQTLPWSSGEGRIGTQPYQKPDQTRMEPEFKPETRPEQNQNSSYLPSEGDRPPTLSSGWGPSTGLLSPGEGDEKKKKSRTGRVKKRKERRKEKKVGKVSCSLPGQGTLTCCPCQEETRDKRVPVAAAGSGLIGWQAGP